MTAETDHIMQKDNSLLGRIGRLRSAAPSYRELLRVRRRTDGAVSVEFALIAPVLLILILIAVDFGVGMYEQQVIANAARAGAQLAVFSTVNSQEGIRTAVANAAQKDAADLDTSSEIFCQCPGGAGVSCTATCDGDAPEVYVRVTVKFKHETLLPYPTLDNPLTLTATSEFRLR